MTRSLTTLDCYVIDFAHPTEPDDCRECQGVGQVEGEAADRNGPYSVLMDCPTCKGSGKVEIDPYEGEE